MAAIKLIGDWSQAKAILAASPKKLEKAINTAMKAEAVLLEGKLKKAFRGLKPPNAPSTILQKKSSKPLIATGDMRNSISVTPMNNGLFIGINRSNAKGVRLAELHENGAVIVQRVTPKMRKFLHALLAKLGPGGAKGSGTAVLVIHIPARPFMRPVFDSEGPKMPDRFLKRVLKLLGGQYGT